MTVEATEEDAIVELSLSLSLCKESSGFGNDGKKWNLDKGMRSSHRL